MRAASDRFPADVHPDISSHHSPPASIRRIFLHRYTFLPRITEFRPLSIAPKQTACVNGWCQIRKRYRFQLRKKQQKKRIQKQIIHPGNRVLSIHSDQYPLVQIRQMQLYFVVHPKNRGYRITGKARYPAMPPPQYRIHKALRMIIG